MWFALGVGAASSLLAGCDEQDVLDQDSASTVMRDAEDALVLQNSRPVMRIYDAHAMAWTQWALGEPHSTGSPIADPTGELCDVSQTDGVWFLAGSFGGDVERTCTIPADQSLFFPLINLWGISPGGSIDDRGLMAEFVATFTGYFTQYHAATCELTLRLDGENLLGTKLPKLDKLLYVDVLVPYECDINPDNWATEFGFEGGVTPMVTNGHYALLNPLEPGEHVLEFGGSRCDGNGNPTFETFATYYLTVEE